MSFAVNAGERRAGMERGAAFAALQRRQDDQLRLESSIFDPELGALNGGLGDYSFSVFTLRRSDGAVTEDIFDLDTAGASFFLLGNSLWTQDGPFGTFSSSWAGCMSASRTAA